MLIPACWLLRWLKHQKLRYNSNSDDQDQWRNYSCVYTFHHAKYPNGHSVDLNLPNCRVVGILTKLLRNYESNTVVWLCGKSFPVQKWVPTLSVHLPPFAPVYQHISNLDMLPVLSPSISFIHRASRWRCLFTFRAMKFQDAL